MSIEKFIADNREAFDDRKPPANAWETIERRLTGNTKKKPFISIAVRWSMAAAATLTIAFFFYSNFNKNPLPVKVPASTIVTEFPVTPEVNEFAKMIILKQEELKNMAKEQPELYKKFTNDMTQLDSSYKSLKQQLSVTPNKELLLEAMIQNLQLQLNVLNQQLNIIKEIKQSKEYSHEKTFQKI